MLKLGGLVYALMLKKMLKDRARGRVLEKNAAGNVPPITSNITGGAPRPPTPAVPGGKMTPAGYPKFNTGAPPPRLGIGAKPPSSLHLPTTPPAMRTGVMDVTKAVKPMPTAGKMVRTVGKAVL